MVQKLHRSSVVGNGAHIITFAACAAWE